MRLLTRCLLLNFQVFISLRAASTVLTLIKGHVEYIFTWQESEKHVSNLIDIADKLIGPGEHAPSDLVVGNQLIVGLDIEWKVSYTVFMTISQLYLDKPQNSFALCSARFPAEKGGPAAALCEHFPIANLSGMIFMTSICRISIFSLPLQLIQLSKTGVSPAVVSLLARPDIIKCGVRVMGDIRKLERDYWPQFQQISDQTQPRTVHAPYTTTALEKIAEPAVLTIPPPLAPDSLSSRAQQSSRSELPDDKDCGHPPEGVRRELAPDPISAGKTDSIARNLTTLASSDGTHEPKHRRQHTSPPSQPAASPLPPTPSEPAPNLPSPRSPPPSPLPPRPGPPPKELSRSRTSRATAGSPSPPCPSNPYVTTFFTGRFQRTPR